LEVLIRSWEKQLLLQIQEMSTLPVALHPITPTNLIFRSSTPCSRHLAAFLTDSSLKSILTTQLPSIQVLFSPPILAEMAVMALPVLPWTIAKTSMSPDQPLQAIFPAPQFPPFNRLSVGPTMLSPLKSMLPERPLFTARILAAIVLISARLSL